MSCITVIEKLHDRVRQNVQALANVSRVKEVGKHFYVGQMRLEEWTGLILLSP